MTDQEFIRNFKLSEETIQVLEQRLDASVEELRNRPLYEGKSNSIKF